MVFAGVLAAVGALGLAGCGDTTDPSGSWYRARYSSSDKAVLTYEMGLDTSSKKWTFSRVEDGQAEGSRIQTSSGVLERRDGSGWLVKDYHGADWSVVVEGEESGPVLTLARQDSGLNETFYRDIEAALEHREGRGDEEADLRQAETERRVAEDLKRACDFTAEFPLTFVTGGIGLYYGPGLLIETKRGRTVEGDYLSVEFSHAPNFSVEGMWSAAWPRNTYYVNVFYSVQCEDRTLYEGIVKTAGSSIELEDVCSRSGSSGAPTGVDLCVFGVEDDRGSLVWGMPYDVMADPYYQEAAIGLALSKGPRYSVDVERIG